MDYSSSALEQRENNFALAQTLKAGNRAESTLNGYLNKWKHFVDWAKVYQQDIVVNNDVRLADATPAVLDEFFGHICRKRDRRTGEYLNPTEFQSVEYVATYRSMLRHIYIMQNEATELPQSFQHTINQFMGGYERRITALKRNGQMSMVEGKQPMTFAGYGALANYAITMTATSPELSTFGHTFLILAWNLMARCNSVATLMFDHITWENDCMVIVFPGHKGDQEGKNCYPKHVYANPLRPEICPVLALALHVFTMGFRRADAKKNVFGGGGISENKSTETEKRFSKWLGHTCSNLQPVLQSMGLSIDDIGTHSFRKGIACFLAGTPGGPSPIAIYLRAGWSLGGVQMRYILNCEGGDQLCGRAATGLPLIDADFAILPPHFGGPVVLAEEWDEILPGYSTFFPASFKPVLPYLVASLAHHQEYLRRTLPDNHLLRHSRIWLSNKLDSWKGHVLLGNGRNDVSNLTATGIPPHVLLANEMVKTRRDLNDFKTIVIERFERIPEEVKQVMLDNFRIDGIVPLTPSQIHSMFSDMEARFVATITAHNEILQQSWSRHSTSDVRSGTRTASGDNSANDGLYATFQWGGRFHPVPEDFSFPK